MIKLRSPVVQNQLWTIISAFVISAYVSVLVFVAARLMDLQAAGILAFAAAVSDLIRALISLAVRTYQGKDVKQEFNFNSYLILRTACALSHQRFSF